MNLGDFVIEWRKSHSDRVTREDLKEMEKHIMALLDDILSDVQDEATVVASVVTLLTNLSDALKAAGTDPVKLAAVKAQIDTNKQAMAAAVAANTPAAPTA
jgi:hypothetical protein